MLPGIAKLENRHLTGNYRIFIPREVTSRGFKINFEHLRITLYYFLFSILSLLILVASEMLKFRFFLNDGKWSKMDEISPKSAFQMALKGTGSETSRSRFGVKGFFHALKDGFQIKI